MEQPPPYEGHEAVNDVFADLKERYTKDPKAVRNAFVKALGGDEVDKQFAKSMEDLVDDIATLKKGFRDVTVTVEQFDLKQFKDKEQKPIPAYKPEWDGLSAKFEEFLRESRSLAGDLRVRVQQFYRVILPLLKRNDIDKAEKLKNLDYFISKATKSEAGLEITVKHDEETADNIRKGFEDLSLKVLSFKVRLSGSVEVAKVALNESVSKLQTDVANLEAKLAGYSTTRDSLAIGAGVAGAVGLAAGVGAMFATGILAPVAIVIAVIGVLGFLGLGSAALYKHFNELADYQDKLNSAKSALAAEVAKQETFAALMSQLNAATTTMENMAGKLNGMGKIFGHIQTDARMARTLLSEALDDAPTYIKEGTIELTTTAYAKLDIVLHAFVTGYDKAIPS